MKKNQYSFLWRENYIDYLWATNVSAKVYFRHSGLFVYDGCQLSAFGSNEELLFSRRESERIFEIDKYQNIFKSLLEIENKARNLSRIFSEINLKKIDDRAIYDNYLKLFSLMRIFVSVYRFTEPQYVSWAEKSIRAYLSKIEPSKEKQEYLLADLLSKKIDANRIFNKDVVKKAKFLKEISLKRFRAKKIDILISDMAESLLRETAKRSFLAVSQVSSLNLLELRRVLLKKLPLNLKRVNKRKKFFYLKITNLDEKSSIKTFLREDEKLFKKIGNPNRKNFLITGSTGYPGVIEGEAYLVPALSTTEEYRKVCAVFPAGKILVAPMTSPNLVPILSKAIAFVTDEGGITSHAALIAREMRKPCVVGTIYGSQIIKNGMKIKVDASNGRVIILTSDNKK